MPDPPAHPQYGLDHYSGIWYPASAIWYLVGWVGYFLMYHRFRDAAYS
jgi:hypothetical protein